MIRKVFACGGRAAKLHEDRALAAAVRRLMDSPDEGGQWARGGRAAVCAQFDRRTQAPDFERLLSEVVPDNERAREAAGGVSRTVQVGSGVS
jgi:hypothetical protein